MAKKNLNPLEDPPTASSSDEDEVETLSGEDGEEEEVEEQISDDSSSEEEDDLMNPFLPATKPKPPSSAVQIPERRSSPAVKPGKKRPSEKTETSAKRAKRVSEESEKKIVEETKRPSFQRLWSEEDEISLLQGMIDFKADTGESPYEDMDKFYEFTRKAISFEPSKVQFVDKIRSLKKKYMGKVKEGVESLPKAHDMECLKLSKYIWGSHGMALKSDVKKSRKKLDSVKPQGKEVEEEEEEEDVAFESAVKSNGTPKKSVKKPISVEANGDNVEEEENVALESAAKSNRTRKKSEKKPISVEPIGEKVEEDRDMLVNGEKVDEDREVLVNGEKAEDDKEALVNGGDSKSIGVMRASDWFEDSFLVRSIASLGVSEQFVRQKWSMVSVETKKRMGEKWKLLQDKEMELVLQKTDFMREVGSVIAEAS